MPEQHDSSGIPSSDASDYLTFEQAAALVREGKPIPSEMADRLREWAKGQDPAVMISGAEMALNGHVLLSSDELRMMHLAEKDTAWVWEELVAPGYLTLVSGRPKAGKSTFLFALAAAVRGGRSFLGQQTRKTKVAYCSEERWRSYQKKVAAFGAPDYAYLYGDKPLNLQQLCEQLAGQCETLGVEMVVIDTWPMWARFPAGGMNDADVVRAQMGYMEELARTVAVVAVGYQRKGEGEYGEEFMGSTEITGRADVLLSIARTNEVDNARVVRTLGRTDAPEELPFTLSEDGDRIESFDRDQARYQQDAARIMVGIREFEAANNGRSPSGTELREQVGMRKDRLLQTLESMHSKSEVIRLGSGPRTIWGLTVPSVPTP